jgi:hypothetical protein
MRAIRAYPVLSSPTTVSELRHRLHSHYASFDVVDYGVVAAIVAVARADGGGSPMVTMRLLVNLAMGLDGHNDLLRFRKNGCPSIPYP